MSGKISREFDPRAVRKRRSQIRSGVAQAKEERRYWKLFDTPSYRLHGWTYKDSALLTPTASNSSSQSVSLDAQHIRWLDEVLAQIEAGDKKIADLRAEITAAREYTK